MKKYSIAIIMKGIINLPLFADCGNKKAFDFNTIIPAEEDDSLLDKWHTPYNTADTLIINDDTVMFDVVDSIPYPIFVKLSKMYPDTHIYMTWMEIGTNNIGTTIYHQGIASNSHDNTLILQVGSLVRCIGICSAQVRLPNEQRNVFNDVYFTQETNLIVQNISYDTAGHMLVTVRNPQTNYTITLPRDMLMIAGETSHENCYDHPDARCVMDGDPVFKPADTTATHEIRTVHPDHHPCAVVVEDMDD